MFATKFLLALDVLDGQICLALGPATDAEPSLIQQPGIRGIAGHSEPQTSLHPQDSLSHLIACAEDMLQKCDCSWRDIAALGVGTGPASFTAARTGLAWVQGLALGLQIPCYATNSLEAVVRQVFVRPEQYGLLVVELERHSLRDTTATTSLFSLWRRKNGQPDCTVSLAPLRDQDPLLLDEIVQKEKLGRVGYLMYPGKESGSVGSSSVWSGTEPAVVKGLSEAFNNLSKKSIEPAGCAADAVWQWAADCFRTETEPTPLAQIRPDYLPGAHWKSAEEQVRSRLQAARDKELAEKKPAGSRDAVPPETS